MTLDSSSNPAHSTALNDRTVVMLFCFLAAIRVFVFSAGFPFFNNVDEQVHFDLVVKYSEGHIPRSLETVSQDSVRYIVLFGTSEYLGKPEQAPAGQFPPPPWTQPLEKIRETIFAKELWWQKVVNYEGSQPPLYYAAAAMWWRLGQLLGFDGIRLLYWLRFLNIVFIVALVWIGFVAARLVFPQDRWMKMGVPLLLAVIPLDSFYGIQNDSLVSVFFGAAFIYLVRWWNADVPDVKLGLALGVTLTGTYFSKLTALPLLALALFLVLIKLYRLMSAGKLRVSLLALLALGISTGFPIGGWMAWVKSSFGDVTGSTAKIAFLGWTHKPLTEWFHHPIFTVQGCWTFLSDLLSSLWRGEFMWHRETLASPLADNVFAISSVLFLLLAFVSLLSRRVDLDSLRKQTLWLALWSVGGAIAFLAMLSVSFDFGACFNPSRQYPFFTAGRLMSGSLVPFAILYVHGLNWGLSKIGFGKAVPLFLVAIAGLATISEIVVNAPAFTSAYNWFHL